MATLSNELRQQCFTVLSKCDEFDSHENLLTVFSSGELSHFRDRLPQQARNLQERIEHTCSYLTPLRTSAGQWVFVLFLETLCGKYPSVDGRHNKLAELCAAVAAELRPQDPLINSNRPVAYVLRQAPRTDARRQWLARIVNQVLDEQNYQLSINEPLGAGNVKPLLAASLVVVELAEFDANMVFSLGIALTLRSPLLIIFDGDPATIPDTLINEPSLFKTREVYGDTELARALHQRVLQTVMGGSTTQSMVQQVLPPGIISALRDPTRYSETPPGIDDFFREQRETREDVSRIYEILQQQFQVAPNVDMTIPQVNELRARLEEMIRKHSAAEQQRAEMERFFWDMARDRDAMLAQIRYAAAVLDGDRLQVQAPRDQAPMVFVPAALFVPGPPRAQAEERFVRAFFIDVYPVTNAQFERFVALQSYETEVERWNREHDADAKLPTWRDLAASLSKEECPDKHPVVMVTRKDAEAYAAWTGAGRRLPTQLEWERAARGIGGRLWPWGDSWEAGRCNMGRGKSNAVDAFPNGGSPTGCFDMIGNVWEWLADQPASELGVIAGGSWGWEKEPLPPHQALRVPLNGPRPAARPDLGFRCVTDDLLLREP